ncbi:MAG TPA: DUF2306 domain-containing protein [Aliidongia sp.]|uniref:DUF2306 domain-containing protein n=1 Tax=Aliidongia sp. TaxID=1914230 RepID=UPI002DDD3C2E|nr:DUF2306 domain-containing protein [Aliidongia sp.]HEV2676208.1 DUF2306 domain-containing protein [Aliidongia sp.]
MNRRVIWSLWGLAAVLSAGVAIFSYRYLLRVGPLSPDILANLYHRPWLDVHVAGAATALLVGPFQFLARLRTRHRLLHRRLGRLYVVGCLAGGVGGFVMAFGSTAGPIATVGFASLAATWIWANVQAWRLAVARRFDAHRAWMIRSFAMTFAAVMLRLYLPLFPLLGVSFVDGYRAVSFLSWVPNLILVELYLRGAFARRPILVQAAE